MKRISCVNLCLIFEHTLETRHKYNNLSDLFFFVMQNNVYQVASDATRIVLVLGCVMYTLLCISIQSQNSYIPIAHAFAPFIPLLHCKNKLLLPQNLRNNNTELKTTLFSLILTAYFIISYINAVIFTVFSWSLVTDESIHPQTVISPEINMFRKFFGLVGCVMICGWVTLILIFPDPQTGNNNNNSESNRTLIINPSGSSNQSVKKKLNPSERFLVLCGWFVVFAECLVEIFIWIRPVQVPLWLSVDSPCTLLIVGILFWLLDSELFTSTREMLFLACVWMSFAVSCTTAAWARDIEQIESVSVYLNAITYQAIFESAGNTSVLIGTPPVQYQFTLFPENEIHTFSSVTIYVQVLEIIWTGVGWGVAGVLFAKWFLK